MWRDVGGESSRPAPLVLADHEQRVTGTLGQRLRTVLGDDLVTGNVRDLVARVVQRGDEAVTTLDVLGGVERVDPFWWTE